MTSARIDPMAVGASRAAVPAVGARITRGGVLRAGRCVAWAALTLILAGTSPLTLILVAAAGLWTWGRWRRETLSVAAWLEHLLSMTAAMYLGMAVYMAVGRPWVAALDAAAGLGGVVRYGGMLLSMAAGMVVLMRAEGHDWRMCGEMCVAMVAPVLVCWALVGIGVGRVAPAMAWLNAASAYDVAHTAMLLGMVALMACRRAMYGAAGSHAMAHGARRR
jgi:hypothetical protein